MWGPMGDVITHAQFCYTVMQLQRMVGSTGLWCEWCWWCQWWCVQGYGAKHITLYDIRAELSKRYKDLRTSYHSATVEECFNLLTKETPETFYIGAYVSVVDSVAVSFSSSGCQCHTACVSLCRYCFYSVVRQACTKFSYAGIVFTLWSGRPARSSAMPVLFLLCGPAGLHEVQLCRYYTYIQMQRLKWHCHSTVAGALYKIIVSNSCSAVFRRKTHETVSSSIPGGTAATMERPWQTTAGHSRHAPLPPGRRGHQVWRVALAAQPVSTWQQTGVADVHLRQQTSEGSQRGMKVQCHWDSDAPTSSGKNSVSVMCSGAAPEHITETEFSPELVTIVVHGGVELCVLTSSLRTPSEQRRSRQTAVAAKVRRKFRPALYCVFIVLCCLPFHFGE